MTTEPWVTILSAAAAVLLAVAAAAIAMDHVRSVRRGRLIATASRGAAIAVLSAAVVLTVAVDARRLLFDLRLVAVILSLVASALHLALGLARGRPAGVWPVDALLAGLLGTLLLVGAAGGAPFDCAQRAFAFSVEWALYLFGSATLLVAGGVGLALLSARGGQPGTAGGLAEFLVPTLQLALVTLGGGLLAGTWWAWQTRGTLLASDQRQVWMAVAWLVTGMALVAGQMEARADRLMSGLAVVAASTATFGLLALPDLLQLWGG